VILDHPDDKSQTIYFSEAYANQLDATKTGFGTFTLTEDEEDGQSFAPITDDGLKRLDSKEVGSVIRWPRWGARINCDYLPNMEQNIIPAAPSGNTFAFIPRDTVATLLTRLNLSVPGEAVLPNSFNLSSILTGNDTALATRDTTGIAYVGQWAPNGLASSYFSQPLSMGEDGNGWLEMEAVLIRLNTAFAPLGKFGVLGNPGPDGVQIGYDMVVCIEAIEPWVLDVYNITGGSPKTFNKVIMGGNAATGWKQNEWKDTIPVNLNSTGKVAPFTAAHDNSRNVLLKDNGKDSNYTPSPTVVAFSGGDGPQGYTRITPSSVSAVLGRADAVQLLPYLAGSQPVLAFSYPDDIVAYCTVGWLILTATLSFTLIEGFVAAFFIPRLPLGIPRRDFGLFSWIAEGERLMDPEKARRGSLYDRKHLDEVKGEIGSKKIRLM
jgi:hypothetical protein